MGKSVLLLVYILTSTIFNIKISYAQSSGKELLACMEHAGDFIYGIHGDLEAVKSRCEFRAAREDSEAHNVFLKSLQGIKEKVAKFPAHEQEICHDQWNADWDRVQAMVFSRTNEMEYYNEGILKIPEDTTTLERAIVERSFIDQAMTRIVGENLKGKGIIQYDGTTCHWRFFNMIMARADNVAFVENEKVKGYYLSRDLGSHAYRPLWFILQHADLYHQFQQDWLETLQKTSIAYGFPERLVESLEVRVEQNKKYQE